MPESKQNKSSIAKGPFIAWGTFLGLFVLFGSHGVLLSAQEVSDITFDEVNNKFGVNANRSDLQKKEGWKQYQDKCVEWEGELVHVDEGIFGGISLGYKHLKTTFTYDVLVSAPSSAKQQALELEINARYSYKVTLKNYGGAILPITADLGCK